ncbi:penicillin-binding transpeptidase domain-containing protein [Krasilnikoviella flava]|uniref:Beta-lactamase n=1 Tax=Krasilnikoviella flava TaxID=526729 RepID=A0A1T5K069_9MICO|nr:penicillin-binding transpeptidase domain-containing protein [Krasilnikoviella flava]SKC56940.1 Cell division protein FtsI/penicillin-binding protein 2 [Krasilnikoviella flava]
MHRRYRLALAVLLTPVVGLPLVACTGTDVPPADEAAAALAAALRAGKVGDVPLQAPGSVDVQTQLSEVLEPLVDAAGTREHTVTVADVGKPVTKDGATTAVATLDWSWPVGRDVTWAYSTDVDLTYAVPESEDGTGTWRPVWSPDVLVPDLAPGERLKVTTLDADRGDLLDGDGEPMVTERGVWHIGVDKTAVEGLGQESAARDLAQLVGLEPNEFFAQVDAAGEKAFVEAITIRKENPGTDFSLEDALDIIGVRAVEDSLELGPTGDFAKPILGRVGEATEEVVEESDGAVQAGDVVGLSGVQRAYDDRLTGSPGVLVSVVAASGADGDVGLDGEPDEDEDEGRELYRVDAVDGTPVATTLDQHLQKLAENVLDDVDPASAIVAVRPSDGAVLAAASGPGSEGWSTATLGQYPPGSTFKVVDALAMQRAGLTPDTEVACTDTITVDGRTFGNVPGYPSSATGDVPLRTAFAHSCNTAMIAQRDKVAQADLATAGSDLGLLDDEAAAAAMGVPAFLGSVPAKADGTEHAASMIGQGKVQASPLGMATVAASVAAGHRVEPVLVQDDAAEEGSDASASPSAEAEKEPATPGVSDGEAQVLRDLMHGVVTDGSADMLQDVPGIVGAKTGTAQYGDGSQQHVWMLAIVDDLAVAVFVEDGHRGSDTAGPLMEDFLDDL